MEKEFRVKTEFGIGKVVAGETNEKFEESSLLVEMEVPNEKYIFLKGERLYISLCKCKLISKYD